MPLKELAERRNLLHRKSDAQTVLRHALEDVQIGDVALVSSFGAESVVLLHMAAQINKDVPVIFLDTEMLFDETLQYQRDVAAKLGLTDVRVVSPDRAQVMEHDVDGILHLADTDACCNLRKTRPLDRSLEGFDAWVSGRKRFQGGNRAKLEFFEPGTDFPRVKVNPLAHWDPSDVQDYIVNNRLKRHPLVRQGYKSIGCAPCTTPVSDGEDPRAGRWRNQGKTECGIHLASGQLAKLRSDLDI